MWSWLGIVLHCYLNGGTVDYCTAQVMTPPRIEILDPASGAVPVPVVWR